MTDFLQQVPKQCYASDDSFKNEYGAIRQCFVEESLGIIKKTIGYHVDKKTGETKPTKIRLHTRPLKESDLEPITPVYVKWKDDSEYFILKGNKPYFAPRITTEDHDFYYTSDGEILKQTVYKIIKGAKRGNDVYRYLISERLKPLNHLRDITFFKPDWVDKRTSMLFITLTCNPAIYDGDIAKAWQSIGTEFHRFIACLLKEYGQVEFFRTWESTKNYNPHVHCLIGFKERSFVVHTSKDGKGKTCYRISKKHSDKISSYWHSLVDIRAISDTHGAVKELTKYITKDLCSEKGYKTNSMLWLFNKQSFSISHGFVAMINDNMALKIEDVKSTDLINTVLANCNSDVEKWEFVGILRGVDLGISDEIWCVDYKDPPSRIKVLIDFEEKRWKARGNHGKI